MSTAPTTSTYTGPVYAWHENVENLERYCPGGYHPVTLETTFKSGRYQVVHKLGYGSFSTVWLARDTMENRYVALKVMVAEDPSASSVEACMRARLRSGDAAHPGRAHVQQALDEFEVEGPNGTHTVLVSEVLGPTLVGAKAATAQETLPVDAARRLTRQLALGLAYVHSCGIVHGDLHSKNVATTLPSLDDWPLERIYATFYGEPERTSVIRLDGQPVGPGAPAYTIQPVYFWNLGMENLFDGAKILDFGEASLMDTSGTSTPRASLNTPAPFRAPEAIFNEPVGPPADIWAFGCTVFDIWCRGDYPGLLLGRNMVFGGSNENRALEQMVYLLGKLPDRWWKAWEMRETFFEEDGSVKQSIFSSSSGNDKDSLLAARVANARDGENYGKEMSDGLLALLQGCLKYEPGERLTAAQILENDWVKESLRVAREQ